MGQTSIALYSSTGTYLGALKGWERAEYGRVVNDVGACRVDVPLPFKQGRWTPAPVPLVRDLVLYFTRRERPGQAWRLVRWYFLRGWEYKLEEGRDVLTLRGYDPVYLLAGRIADAYYNLNAVFRGPEYATAMMRAVVVDHLLSGTATGRNLSGRGVSAGTSAQAGAQLSLAFPNENVLDVLKEIARISREAGTAVYFDFEPGDGLNLQFRTYVGVRGVDRTAFGVTFSPEAGTLTDVSMSFEHEDEVTVALAGGGGSVQALYYIRGEDTARINASPYNRRETFVAAWSENDPNRLIAISNERLMAGRPRRTFSGTLVPGHGAEFGRDWDFGDKVLARYRDQTFACTIDRVVIRAERDPNTGEQAESVEARLETEEFV